MSLHRSPYRFCRHLGAALAAALAIAGCRVIVGVDDKYLIDDRPGASSGGGTAGSGGRTSTGSGGATATGGMDAGCDPDAAPPPQCAPGTADCNGDPCDGCEVDLDADADNCGRCGRSCEGQSCGAGMCTPLALAPSGAYVYDLAVHGGRLYWAHDKPGKVLSVSVAGGPYDELANSDPAPGGIAVDDTHVYWASLFSNTYGIARVPLAGGAVEVLAPQESYTDRILLDGGFVYFATSGLPAARVGRVPEDGGAVEMLYSSTPAKDRALPIAIDATRLYWGIIDGPDLGIWSIAKDGSDLKQHTSLGAVAALAVDDDAIYWPDAVSKSLLKLDKAGGALHVLASNQAEVRMLQIDADTIYFASHAAGTLARVGKDGSGYRLLAAGQSTDYDSLNALAVDDAHVYWVAGGFVMRTPK